MHIDAPAPGYYTLRIDVLNNSSDPLRNMVYVDGFRIYGGEGVGAPATAADVSTLVNGTLAALLGAEYIVMTMTGCWRAQIDPQPPPQRGRV